MKSWRSARPAAATPRNWAAAALTKRIRSLVGRQRQTGVASDCSNCRRRCRPACRRSGRYRAPGLVAGLITPPDARSAADRRRRWPLSRASGSSIRLKAARNSAEPGMPLLYQPICLRAMREPAGCRNESAWPRNARPRLRSVRLSGGSGSTGRCAGNGSPGAGTRGGHRLPRPIITPSAPDSASADVTPRRSTMSPLTMTGIFTASLTSAHEAPIGLAVVELAAGAAMDGDHADAAVLGDAGQAAGRCGWHRPSRCASSRLPAASPP